MKSYRRILLKLSGESLGGEKGFGFDSISIDLIVDQILKIKNLGIEIAIVIGGGNFFRGAKNSSFSIDRVAADKIGMLATVMNGLYLKELLKSKGISADLMSGLSVPEVSNDFSKEIALEKLRNGEILIFGGGTGNPFFSTDTASALRALEIEADIVIKGTKVDGVYDSDPMLNKSAKMYDHLTYSSVLEKKLLVMDAAAIALCRENRMPISVINITKSGALLSFLQGKSVGTLVEEK